MEFVRLNTGIQIPIVGSGTNTYGKENRDYSGTINDDTTELIQAIKAGYRHFDTAIAYRNEAVVGKAIQESGIERDDFFLTSKIPGNPEYTNSEKAVIDAVESSLKALGTDYLDLYLIHHPWENLDEIVEVWKVLEQYVDQGTLKSIGVSNFDETQLDYLLQHARIKPAVNQIQSHPGNWNHEIIDYSLQHQVIPEAWGPLSRTDETTRNKLTEIGKKYNKTWAQVVLRYQIERGVIVIPKSHNPDRQKDNLEIFDFTLSEDDKNLIATL